MKVLGLDESGIATLDLHLLDYVYWIREFLSYPEDIGINHVCAISNFKPWNAPISLILSLRTFWSNKEGGYKKNQQCWYTQKKSRKHVR